MKSGLTGWKITALRKERGVSQAELARRVGLSAPYLNLIERNKRPAPAAALDRIAAGLGIERALLDGEAERRLAGDISEIAADPVLAAGPDSPKDVDEFVGRHPDWAGLVLRLYRAYRDQQQSVLALADRLNHDPFLGESIHRVLTHVTSVRSAAEILGEAPLKPADQERFLRIISSDSGKLSETAQALVSFFDNTDTRIRSGTSMEHVDAFIFETNNYFETLEWVAGEFVAREGRGETAAVGVALRTPPVEAGDGVSQVRSPQSRQFDAVRTAIRPMAEAAIETIVSTHPTLASEEARQLARSALLGYATAAVLMPYEKFLDEARRSRYDLDILCARFGVSYEQAAHRLATLRRPGAEGVRFAYMRSDPSGFVTKRLPLSGLPLPRYGTACPLWVVYGAFQSPGVTVRSFGELPDGEQFLFFARAIDKRPPSIGRPRHLLSVMLACPATEAAHLVYGDGLERRSATVPVGTVCRLCSRVECDARQEMPLIA